MADLLIRGMEMPSDCYVCRLRDGVWCRALPGRVVIYESEHRVRDDYCPLSEVPSADVEPVRHGRWIRITKDEVDPQEYRCNVCGRLLRYYGEPALLSIRYPYCHCGARMDGEEDDV